MTTHKIPWRIYVALIGSLVGTGIYSFALPIAILASTGEIGLAGRDGGSHANPQYRLGISTSNPIR